RTVIVRLVQLLRNGEWRLVIGGLPEHRAESCQRETSSVARAEYSFLRQWKSNPYAGCKTRIVSLHAHVPRHAPASRHKNFARIRIKTPGPARFGRRLRQVVLITQSDVDG